MAPKFHVHLFFKTVKLPINIISKLLLLVDFHYLSTKPSISRELVLTQASRSLILERST